MYTSNKRLLILDADGTTIDAFSAIEAAFLRHGLVIGDETRFQKRHQLFKYLGGLKEFPAIIKKNLRKNSRAKLVDSLTQVYRQEASLYAGIPDLIRELIAAPDIVVGMVTRNITHEPLETLRQLFARHGIDIDALDFFVHIPLSERKTQHFRAIRERFGINPARAYVCGDEHKDFAAAVGSGMHPFIVSYGFEDHDRLTLKFEVPPELIARTPDELSRRVRHALDLRAQKAYQNSSALAAPNIQ
ncbi:HAD family hydrolase [Massilia sp. 9096]|uniref:HAD family hydrolase n=1 Tax=Massilia sp. 9096 TaxID=1500894 RepID=UPI00056D25AB|nr:HAD hydrolase-like protein [Massilia sp. 9096]